MASRYTVCGKSLQLCLTLCESMDCSLPGFSVHGILQARILEWVAISFFRGSSQLSDWTRISYVSCTGRWVLYHNTTHTTLEEKDMAFSTWYDTVGSGEGVLLALSHYPHLRAPLRLCCYFSHGALSAPSPPPSQRLSLPQLIILTH